MRIAANSDGYTAEDIAALRSMWDRDTNFLLSGSCVPFDYTFPPLHEVVDRLRKDEDTRVRCADKSVDDESFARDFRSMPIERAMEAPFAVAHFKLTHFTGRRDILFGLWDGVMRPWTNFLSTAGFSWYRCYPIIFISSSHMKGNYHMDGSYVVAWQIYGTKIFNGFADPESITPLEQAIVPEYRKAITKPENPDDSSVLGFEMPPGTVLWNQLLTPHWVDAGDDGEPAMSLNISHGGLRCDGVLSRRGEAIESRYREYPEERF